MSLFAFLEIFGGAGFSGVGQARNPHALGGPFLDAAQHAFAESVELLGVQANRFGARMATIAARIMDDARSRPGLAAGNRGD